jgi:hypothetical protein
MPKSMPKSRLLRDDTVEGGGPLLTAVVVPIVGIAFLHSRVLNGNLEPQKYRITRIADGAVYYRALDGETLCGTPQYSPIEQFQRWCKEVVSD